MLNFPKKLKMYNIKINDKFERGVLTSNIQNSLVSILNEFYSIYANEQLQSVNIFEVESI